MDQLLDKEKATQLILMTQLKEDTTTEELNYSSKTLTLTMLDSSTDSKIKINKKESSFDGSFFFTKNVL